MTHFSTYAFFGVCAIPGSKAHALLWRMVDDYGANPAPTTIDGVSVVAFGDMKGIVHYGMAITSTITRGFDGYEELLLPVDLDKTHLHRTSLAEVMVCAVNEFGIRIEEVGRVGLWMVAARD